MLVPFSSFHFMQNSGDTGSTCAKKSCSNNINVDDRASSSCSCFEFKLPIGSSSSRLSPQLIGAGFCPNGLFNQNQDQYFSKSSELFSTMAAAAQPNSEERQMPAPLDKHDLPVVSKVDELIQDGRSNLSTPMPSSDQKVSISFTTFGRKTDEGYNWRKYGQKVVKGSEFPRSYYKCTYPKCEVKKTCERTPNGHITGIIYKGSHDHPKPQATWRHNPGALITTQDDTMGRTLSSFTSQDDKLYTSGMECNVSPAECPRQENERLVGPGSEIQVTNEDPSSKLRKIEDELDFKPVIKPIREPRVIVQTMSQVDILDDGYRWRKYGQKVVRGNPNPRSYYKCTVAGCTVRKHVERASHDPKSVLTTYEGKHNHDLPVARSTNHEFAVAASFSGGRNIRAEGQSG